MASSSGSKMSKFFVWAILLMLIVGLGGFGIGGFGRSLDKIGSIGNKKISTNDYVNTLRQEISNFERQNGKPISFNEALTLGLDGVAINKLLTTASMDSELSRIGISVGDAEIAKRVSEIPQFFGPDGVFDQDTYRMVISQIGKTVSEFEGELRANLSRDLLRQAVTGGLESTDTYANNIYNYINEERSLRSITLTKNNLQDSSPIPTETELSSFLEDNKESFRELETKVITYSILRPEMLFDQIKVSDKTIKELFDSRASMYNPPEKRRVNRLAFVNKEAASKAYDLIASGKSTFDDLVKERGLSSKDTEIGMLSKQELSSLEREVVFDLPLNEASSVIESSIGPAIFKVIEIETAVVTPIENVMDELINTLKLEDAKNLITTKKETYEDLLVSGGTLEELATESGFKIKTMDFTTELSNSLTSDISFFEEAKLITKDYYPTLFDLKDGSIIAIRLDKVLPSFIPELQVIREKVKKDWTSYIISERLTDLATEISKQLRVNPDWENSAGKEPKVTKISRLTQNLDTPFPLAQKAFITKVGTVDFVNDAETVIVYEVTDVTSPDLNSAAAKAFSKEFNEQMLAEFENDVFSYYIESIRKNLGFTLDQGALNSIHQQF